MFSFTLQVKNELARTPLAKRCCALAEIKAFLQVSGLLVLGENTRKILIPTEHAPVARRLFSLIKNAFKITPVVLTLNKNRLRKKHSYIIQISKEEDINRILQELDLFSAQRAPSDRASAAKPVVTGISAATEAAAGAAAAAAIVIAATEEAVASSAASELELRKEKNREGKGKEKGQRDRWQGSCCRRAYLRGAFLAGGSLTNPEREYHMEMVVPYEYYAQEIVRLLVFFSMDIRYFQRKGDFVLYLKGGEKIGDFLRIIAAHSGLLSFENIRVVKGVRNQINRLVNCETANLTKTIFASQDQIESIRLIQRTIGLENISSSLREIAELRLNNPEATLKELGDQALPPLSKSSVNHRLRRLNALALKIGKRNGDSNETGKSSESGKSGKSSETLREEQDRH